MRCCTPSVRSLPDVYRQADPRHRGRGIALPTPGADLSGVRALRTAADALKAALGPGKRLAVVGGGYSGWRCPVRLGAGRRDGGAGARGSHPGPSGLPGARRRYYETHGVS